MSISTADYLDKTTAGVFKRMDRFLDIMDRFADAADVVVMNAAAQSAKLVADAKLSDGLYHPEGE